jgi:hypothetical protein
VGGGGWGKKWPTSPYSAATAAGEGGWGARKKRGRDFFFHATSCKKNKKNNHFKFGLVLLSASVERVGVSRMWDFFSPTSRSRISNIFRDSESLEKSNVKKWYQILTFLFENCIKLPRKKKSFFFLSLFSLLRYRLTVFLPPLPEVGCPIFLEIRNPWGKVMERSGLRYEHFV